MRLLSVAVHALCAGLSGGALVCLLLAGCPARADDVPAQVPDTPVQSPASPVQLPDVPPAETPDLGLRNGAVIATEATLIGAYGVRKWWHSDFGGGFDTTNEGWFGANTQFGGTDKLGHMYVNYANVRLLTQLFESLGNDRGRSVLLAAWATLGIFTGVEIGDGFSRQWQFSPQDEVANVAGVAFGVLCETHPDLDRALDFRVDYRRSPLSPHFDPFSDYSELKFLFVVKADGFASLRENHALRYLELAVGYGAQGYDTGGPRSRTVYLGLSLNLARLLADGAYGGKMHSTSFQRGTDRLFDLVQFPSVVYARQPLQ
ncbi:MAG TPA: DUF2279 domain-containing protein [Gallionellaceae bacterium]|nr:DUF2279 domain-containing protein [Gallionellaceae bacterium]